MTGAFTQRGVTVIELVVSIAVAAMLLAGLQQLLAAGTATMSDVTRTTNAQRDARFAMQRIVAALSDGETLIVPQRDNPSTVLAEHIREQTFPAGTPPAGSSLASAVLAISIGRSQDLDADGIADADNDGDGRINEDPPADLSNDGEPGLAGFDDDGNGTADYSYSPAGDDDESNDLAQSEDPVNGRDDDGDGSVDEDPPADVNNDNAPGILGVDDDGDGLVDEGNADDDDEDGQSNEDWYDVVVFYLNGSSLIERRPVPWDENGSGSVTGTDYVESVIATDVSRVRFERVPIVTGQTELVDITLELTGPTGDTTSLQTRVRVVPW